MPTPKNVHSQKINHHDQLLGIVPAVPLKDLVQGEIDRERAAFESVKNKLLAENTELQHRLAAASKELAELKKKPPAKGVTGSPNELAKDITRMSSLRASATALQKLKKVVGNQVPLGPEDCPDHRKELPDEQKTWQRLGMKCLDEKTYFGMHNILF
ncbi:hypothetical protein CJU89_6114 [Yarrowia sp. B02]|nr:hypothetical protein CJU89_6114 [Yarrowia sp. B02]